MRRILSLSLISMTLLAFGCRTTTQIASTFAVTQSPHAKPSANTIPTPTPTPTPVPTQSPVATPTPSSTASNLPANARYMATTGVDSGDCSNSNSPCLTLQYAMTRMQGGDTLIIDDGDYTSVKHLIDQFHHPPSGTPGNFTTIRARNIPCQDGIACDQRLRVRFSGSAKLKCTAREDSLTYVKFQGIRWDGINTCMGWNHLYFKQVASQGVEDGNNSSIGINGQHNLLEDVVAFGKGRYKILFYDVDRGLQTWGPGYNLCRRCIIRQDWAIKNDTNKDPIGGIISYFNRNTAILNSIVIDSDTPSEWQDPPTDMPGAFGQVVDDGPHAFVVKGSMAINVAMAAYNNRNSSSGHIISDFAAAKVAGGLGLQGDTLATRITILNAGTHNFTYRSAAQMNTVLALNDGVFSFAGSSHVQNAIFRDIAGNGIRGSGITSDFINLFNIGLSQYLLTAPASHLFTFDPLTNGLLHLPQIEPATPLATQGSAGGQMGARIVNRLGIDGTFQGDLGWDVEQPQSLWPWPLEAWIQAEMRTSQYTTDPNRGFCAQGQTLSQYIWGFLGN